LNHNSRVLHSHTFANLVAQSGRNVFLLFVFALPFQRVIFFRENLFGIQGMKPLNLLSAAVLAYLMFHATLFRTTDKIEQRSIGIFILYFVTLAVALIRSIPNAPLFHSRFPDVFPDSYLDYVLSSCIVPAFYLLPFLFILKHMCSVEELERTTTVICQSVSLLSVAVVVIFLLNPSVVLSGNRDDVAELCETYFGIHYNTLGTIYICTAPLLLYKFLERNALWIVPVALALVAVLLLQSRSALVTVAVSCCLLLIQRRRFAILVLGGILVGITSLLWIGPTIDALLSIGFDDSTDFSADALMTGRVDFIWVPLLTEWTSDVGLFLFGAGRYGIMTSQLWSTGALFHATHAHNAIINFFLDCGAILTAVLLIFLVVGVTTAWNAGRSLNSDLYWALFICLLGFGIGMATERDIFPTISNMYVFPIVAMMINLARLRHLEAYRDDPTTKAGAG
jgi:hypothetical protein